LAVGAAGCEAGGVGDPCTPEDEYFETFSGFSLGEVNVESRSFQCETRVCLVNKFQGRVSCPYGTNGTNPDPTTPPTVDHPYSCEVPVFGGAVTVPVQACRTERPPELSEYCSCRCAGADPNARYCECPSGFSCTEVVVDQNRGQEQLAGYYCIRSGSNVDPNQVDSQKCELNGPGDALDPLRDLTCGAPPSDYPG
jgi:hypothetical protein